MQEYLPGRKVVFRFEPRRGRVFLQGIHFFEAVPCKDHMVLRHVIQAHASFGAHIKRKLLIEPLHDALVEDAFDKAQTQLGSSPAQPAGWGLRVRLIRWLLQRMRA